MNTIISLAALLFTVILVTDGKRFKRDLQQRDLVEAAHAVKDVESLQCILDTTPKCQKELYLRDLKGELTGMNVLLEKLRGIDWFGGGHHDLWTTVEHDEWEILESWGRLQGMLPQTYDEATGAYQNFDKFLDKCNIWMEDLSAQPDCQAAKAKAMDLVTECEATGFQQALKILDTADIDDAKNLAEGMKHLMEILAEVRDVNYFALGIAFVDCADYPTPDTFSNILDDARKHIGAGVEELFKMFGGDDKRSLVTKKSIATQIKSINFDRYLNTKVNSKSTETEAEIQNLIRSILKKY